MTNLWPHQTRALGQILALFSAGTRSVCAVCPTGGGKTRLAAAVAAQLGLRTLFLTHRIELNHQAKRALPFAHCTTVQQLTCSGERPEADLLILDECHHYVAAEWRQVAGYYRGARVLGLTATPERGDGTPLGDLFESLVVVAHYSELIESGHIVDCCVWTPETANKALAATVEGAYLEHCAGQQTLVFCRFVREAYECAEVLSSHATCGVIEGGTPKKARENRIESFGRGETQVLCNVFVLTEGFDAPEATAGILTRLPQHPSTYLQMVGRLLRSAKGKGRAVWVDLTGCYRKHGFPTDDREYSLDGRAIRQKKQKKSLWNCKKCGCFLSVRPKGGVCPACGHAPTVADLCLSESELELIERERVGQLAELKKARVFMELQDAALNAKKGDPVKWVARQFRRETGVHVPQDWIDSFASELPSVVGAIQAPAQAVADRRSEYQRLLKLAYARGYQQGWAAHKFKAKFGDWPRWEWRTG